LAFLAAAPGATSDSDMGYVRVDGFTVYNTLLRRRQRRRREEGLTRVDEA
jgi:hypothetical protein